MRQDNVLGDMLYIAVSLCVAELQAQGGPTDDDWATLSPLADVIGEHGDDLLFKGKKRGATARIFNQTARAIAVMSFAPGGVTCFDHHYETKGTEHG